MFKYNTYLYWDIVELCDKGMFDPIHKVFRRKHSKQIGANDEQMIYKDNNFTVFRIKWIRGPCKCQRSPDSECLKLRQFNLPRFQLNSVKFRRATIEIKMM